MKLIFEIVTEQGQTLSRIEALKREIKALNKEISNPAYNAGAVRGFTKDLLGAKTELNELRAAQKAFDRDMKALSFPKDSVIGMRLEYAKLTQQIYGLSKAELELSKNKALVARAQSLDAEISRTEQSLGRFTRQVGNYQKGLVQIGDLVTGGLITGGVFALIGGLQRLGDRIVDINAQVSDSVADVAKAADVSIDFVNTLADTLEQRDTRTSLLDQLDIAEIGGKLGVAKEQLLGFTEAVDIVNVALGDQFGGSVELTTETIGKLRNVLLDVKTVNIGEDIVGIGNALNFLEAQGAASASTIADFAGRIGGVASPLGVSAGKILGVSATLDELAVNAERGSSAFVRILQRVAAAPAAFAAAAGVPAKEFEKLVNEDIFGAVRLFLEKLNDKNLKNTELVSVLKELKLNGVGTAETVAKLGANLDLLDKRVIQGTKSVKESNSVTQEFEKKNATLGATLDKLRNAFDNLFTNSSFGGLIAEAVQSLADLVNEIGPAADKLFDFSAATNATSVAHGIMSDAVRDATTQLGKESVETERNFNILRNNKSTQEQRNKAIADLTKLYPTLLTQQQLESANITQLNGLQILATNTLRTQITERLKLRAKEGIETEIVQRKIRRAEIENTPDRALLGELTAGETINNFGILDPKKLRANLLSQIDGQVKELERSSKRVDSTFSTLARTAEDELSPALQDQLDKFRQFNDRGAETGKVIDLTTKSASGLAAQVGAIGDKTKKSAKEIDYAVGSLEDLEEKLRKAQEALQKTAPEKINDALLQAVRNAENDVIILKAQLRRRQDGSSILSVLNDNTQRSPDQIVNDVRGIGGSAQTDDKIDLSDAAREAIIENNAEIVDDEQFTAEQIQVINDLLTQGKLGNIDKVLSAEEAAAKRREELEDLAIEKAIDSAQTVADAVFNIQKSRVDQDKNAELAQLDEVYAARIEQAQGNATELAAIQKELEVKKSAIEKEAANKRKEIAKKEAAVNLALAILKALTGAPPPANFILAAATAIAGAVQLAVIERTAFAKGGYTGSGGERDFTGRRVAGSYMKGNREIVYHENEYIAPHTQIQRFPALFDWLENDRIYAGKPFAAGGFTRDFTPQIAVPVAAPGTTVQVSANAGFTPEQLNQIGAVLGVMIGEAVAAKVGTAVAIGLQDANRRLERESDLNAQRPT